MFRTPEQNKLELKKLITKKWSQEVPSQHSAVFRKSLKQICTDGKFWIYLKELSYTIFIFHIMQYDEPLFTSGYKSWDIPIVEFVDYL